LFPGSRYVFLIPSNSPSPNTLVCVFAYFEWLCVTPEHKDKWICNFLSSNLRFFDSRLTYSLRNFPAL
jgi:hypothetical protein